MTKQNGDPPVKRFRLGPGGVVEHLEEAPPVLESEIQKELKESPKRHISGRKLTSNPSTPPLTSLSDHEENDNNASKEVTSNKNPKENNKQLQGGLTLSGVALIVVLIFAFLKLDIGTENVDSGVSETLPESTEIIDGSDGENALHLFKVVGSFIWETALTVIGFILRILGTILGF